ncbi:hypothetical protein H8959_008635 [Pygathrix nigripes]
MQQRNGIQRSPGRTALDTRPTLQVLHLGPFPVSQLHLHRTAGPLLVPAPPHPHPKPALSALPSVLNHPHPTSPHLSQVPTPSPPTHHPRLPPRPHLALQRLVLHLGPLQVLSSLGPVGQHPVPTLTPSPPSRPSSFTPSHPHPIPSPHSKAKSPRFGRSPALSHDLHNQLRSPHPCPCLQHPLSCPHPLQPPSARAILPSSVDHRGAGHKKQGATLATSRGGGDSTGVDSEPALVTSLEYPAVDPAGPVGTGGGEGRLSVQCREENAALKALAFILRSILPTSPEQTDLRPLKSGTLGVSPGKAQVAGAKLPRLLGLRCPLVVCGPPQRQAQSCPALWSTYPGGRSKLQFPRQIQAETPQEGQGNPDTARQAPSQHPLQPLNTPLRDPGCRFLGLGQHDEALQG